MEVKAETGEVLTVERGRDPLYAVVSEYLDVLDMIAEAEGEVTPEVEALLQASTDRFEQKVERCALAIRQKEAESKMVREEAARLAERARSWDRAVEWLRGYVLDQMKRAGESKVKTPLVTVSVGKSEKVNLSVEPDALPEQYRKVKVEALKYAIAAALKRGEAVEGATLEVSTHLSIR